jgi:hypothetical protein
MSNSDSVSFEFVFGARSQFIYVLGCVCICVCAPRYVHTLVVLVNSVGGTIRIQPIVLKISLETSYPNERMSDCYLQQSVSKQYYMLSRISTQQYI